MSHDLLNQHNQEIGQSCPDCLSMREHVTVWGSIVDMDNTL